jgi:hypothetical protein
VVVVVVVVANRRGSEVWQATMLGRIGPTAAPALPLQLRLLQ